MEVKINLLNDWEEYLQHQIVNAGYTVNQTSDHKDLAYQFFNILKRRVSVVPRIVHESDVFGCPDDHKVGYQKLKKRFSDGDDVTPYLSKRALTNGYEDPLLNDWGIHHFHLGERISNGFIDRTGPLLFALVRESDVYCIYIKNHGAWCDQDLIKILDSNWPSTIEKYRMNEVAGLSHSTTDADISNLRKANVNAIIEVRQGVVYGPIGGGRSLSGTSITSRMRADRECKYIENIEKYVRENSAQFADQIERENIGSEMNFKLHIDEAGLGVLDTNSGTLFRMD